jgi:aquaporin Z
VRRQALPGVQRRAVPAPGKYCLVAGFVCEVVMTFIFLVIIFGSTHKRAPAGFAGLALNDC